MFRIVPAGPGRERRPSPFWDPGPALCLSYHKLPEDATGCAGACRAGGCGLGNDKNGCKRKARAQEGPCPTAGCARLGRGSLPPVELEKNGPLAARAPGFWGWESALFGCAGACHAGGCGPGNGKIAANEKRGRRRAPSHSGMCAAWARQLAARRTREKRTLSGPRSWFLGMGKRLVWLRRSHVAQAAMNREMTKMAANEKRGRRRALSRSGMCAAWARQLAAQTAASKGRGFFFHGRKFGRGVESLFHF